MLETKAMGAKHRSCFRQPASDSGRDKTRPFKMLFGSLIYTGLTRDRKLAVLVGTRKALAMAVKNQDTSQRQTYLKELLRSESVSC